ncbi:GlxA family transcriptional regulator [Pseudooceanicola atlanticus]|uniref:GlxA family transcriptional regulator n=1 Tax=Pseudooceanicola atlanticus TaxID=1461694 RepID=UPI0023524863|nr:helix-turn-helix domain-containing protein [Pseudooceanicola atlanticus]
MPDTPIRARIALLGYEGVQMSAVLGLIDLLEIANRYGKETGAGQILLDVLRDGALPDTRFDAVWLPPNLTGQRGAADTVIHTWLSDRHQAGALICSACAGAFWLGHAGLLDGRPVTTHWALEPEFRAAFPKAQLHAESILVDDHDIVTAGGVMAWVDLGLHLVKRWLGAEVVSQVCRHMLIDPQGREQRNYRSFRPRLDHGDTRIRDLQVWMEANVTGDLSVTALASRCALPERSLQRRFTRATGLPLSTYAQELRVEKARGLLERSQMPVNEICWAVGYEDPSAFSRLFRSVSGLSASEYRKRFRIR